MDYMHIMGRFSLFLYLDNYEMFLNWLFIFWLHYLEYVIVNIIPLWCNMLGMDLKDVT